jgi:hypothetical protein
VRWDALFADLEAAAEAEERLEYEADVVEQARAEYAAVHLSDRLRAHGDRHAGQDLVCHLSDGSRLQGRVRDVAAQWLLMRTGQGDVLIPMSSLTGVEGLGRASAAPAGVLDRRVGLAVVLRRLAVQRVPVRLTLAGAAVVAGTVDRVGADHFEFAVHPLDVPRRPATVSAVRAVPTAALVHLLLPAG